MIIAEKMNESEMEKCKNVKIVIGHRKKKLKGNIKNNKKCKDCRETVKKLVEK